MIFVYVSEEETAKKIQLAFAKELGVLVYKDNMGSLVAINSAVPVDVQQRAIDSGYVDCQQIAAIPDNWVQVQ
jgi:hypothetical protein